MGFVRRRTKGYMLRLAGLRYWNYPKVVELMMRRGEHYNQQVAYVDRLQKSGQAFVIRPRGTVDVGRVEKNPKKLRNLYDRGYADGEACCRELMAFLEKCEKI